MSPVCAVPPVPDFNVVIVSASGAVPDIVMTSPTLLIARARALDPAGTAAGGPTAILTSSSPVLDPPAVNLIIFVLAFIPSCALITYVVLSFGVRTVPPRAIAAPFIEIVEFERAAFGILLRVLADPEITHEVKVLFSKTWFCVRYTSPGVPHETTVPLLVRYFPAPVSPLMTILLPDNSKLSPEISSSIF